MNRIRIYIAIASVLILVSVTARLPDINNLGKNNNTYLLCKEVIEKYYLAMEDKDLEVMIECFDSKMHENMQKNIAELEQVFNNIKYELKFNYIVNNSFDIVDKETVVLGASIHIGYSGVTGGNITEFITLKKKNNIWAISKIMSYDKYVSLRSYEYETLMPPKFLTEEVHPHVLQ